MDKICIFFPGNIAISVKLGTVKLGYNGNSVFLEFYKTCSCCLGFSSMGRNDESTLFFDGSNL